MDTASQTDTQIFIDRWQQADGSERANYQLFLTELTELLALERPTPAAQDTENNAYVFERKVRFKHADGSESHGFIDLYKRGCFVCEAKQTNKTLDSDTWDAAMLRAHGQAQQYARALPADEGRPPFLIITDVGRSIELYAEFSRSGATYVPYPDPRSHRIRLDDLNRPEIQQTLTAVWNDPLSLDPARRSARVTREIAAKLATLAKSLEAANHSAETVAAFLMRCLFTMFAEDVGLLPERCFTELLGETRKQPELFPRLVPGLWQAMNTGGFSPEIRADVLRFNGGLFAHPDALPLDKPQIDLLIEAAQADWRHVEPAIFGTLLERALDPHERHKLGAHYTPRAYVERLVMPTVIEPLRDEWTAAQAAALTLDRQGKRQKAIDEIRRFHDHLCHIRVLDPACGSGNFLYVTLEHLKRLEGEVLNTLDELGETQGMLEMAGSTVDPHQMLGLETNPRAAHIAEAVLWIGYLQWHFRTRGNVSPPEPVLKDFHNIENRDAVLAWDRIEYVTDESGRPVMRWDGRTMKKHPVTGEDVPDETARIPTERYINPRKAGWPEADFVVGNPPFIGKQNIRAALGDGYVEALRETYLHVPESADFVMYWWHHAADLTREGKLRRFGLITTNSLRQAFNRRVIEFHLAQKKPLSLVFAIPDHPWVDGADGAAVRIAMTAGEGGDSIGQTAMVATEKASGAMDRNVELKFQMGRIHADLTVGANVSGTAGLLSNDRLSNTGFILGNRGFVLSQAQRDEFLRQNSTLAELIRPLYNGNDIVGKPRNYSVIDAHGFSEAELRNAHPEIWQWLFDRVYLERQENRDPRVREFWWVFRRSNEHLRAASSGLPFLIVSPETAKHRVFTKISASARPEHSLVVFSLADPFLFGVLSSRIHVAWALAAGGTLEDRPRYNKTRCFETFPFPDVQGRTHAAGGRMPRAADPSDTERTRIADLAEQLDAHRKRQQSLHPDLTMTGMYNVLEKLRAGAPLTPKEQTIHEQGLVSVLKQIHDDLDEAVYAAYGWDDLWRWDQAAQRGEIYDPANDTVTMIEAREPGGLYAAYVDQAKPMYDEILLQRLVDLNAERAAEEARGLVRWLRPEFQNPDGEQPGQEQIDTGETVAVEPVTAKKQPWPKSLPEQIKAVRNTLAAQPLPTSAEQLARQFNRAQTKKVAELLETLQAIGQVQTNDAGKYLAT